MTSFDAIIIGAGAAGMMCAAIAGKRGKKVLLLEAAKDVGKKIRISGGGRCNFTNLDVTPKNFLSQNEHFAISALKRFSSQDFINLVKKHEIKFHEKTLGQLFCDGSSKEIIQMLIDECSKGGVEILTEKKVNKIRFQDGKYDLDLFSKEKFSCQSLVIATGGISIPKMGATPFGYEVAKQFGLKIIETTPALVPLVFADKLLEKTKNLSGIAIDSEVSFGKIKFKEAVLFTHKGISGPAILQISSYLKKGDEVMVNFLPKINLFEFLKEEKERNPKVSLNNILPKYLPKNFVNFMLEEFDFSLKLADLSHEKIRKISQKINNWKFIPKDTEGFDKAEVTLGGVDVDEISSKNFESKKQKGLFFIGEVLDVTGHLGGFNFQWAWSSGFAAGNAV